MDRNVSLFGVVVQMSRGQREVSDVSGQDGLHAEVQIVFQKPTQRLSRQTTPCRIRSDTQADLFLPFFETAEPSENSSLYARWI